ncbi:MAG: ParB/RepB/Spo0J family partition protein [Oscillospiraceae bacterium]|nr:ParB/RepB/Spo0J family partition protein [Oscillospiraceae bacterium]
MAGKGLGTGLEALFGSAAVETGKNDFEYLPISRVEPRHDQPREYFDEAGISELASSIAEHGVLQPLTVRRIGRDGYQIIAGERRWRAARVAGLTEIPARIIEADDRKATELALVENLQREGLNPVEEAAGYRTLMTEYGLTQEDVADTVGKSRPLVANTLRLLKLPEDVLKLLKDGDIAPGAARALLSLENDLDISAAADEVVRTGMSVREAEAYVKRLNTSRSRKKSAPAPFVDYAAAAARELSEKLGRKVRIADGKRKGRIELEYYGAEDRERLLDALASMSLSKEQHKENE